MKNLNENQKPIWLTGLPKSGTTLFQNLADGHSDLLVYPHEPSFPRLFDRHYKSGAHAAKDWLYGTPTALSLNKPLRDLDLMPEGFYYKGDDPIPEDFDLDADTKKSLIESLKLDGLDEADQSLVDFKAYHQWLDDHLKNLDGGIRDIVIETANAYKAAINSNREYKYWVFKYPVNFLKDQISWFFQNFPNGHCIILVRDPRGQFNSSKVDRLKRKNPLKLQMYKGYTDNLLYEVELLARNYETIEKLGKIYGAKRITRLHYEDLVADPEKEMKKITDRLGIAFDPIMTKPTKLGRATNVITGRENFKSAVSTASQEIWKKELTWLEKSAIESRLGDYFDNKKDKYKLSQSSVNRLAARALLAPYRFKHHFKNFLKKYFSGDYPL